MNLREGLRSCHNDLEPLVMVVITTHERKLVAYLVYKADVANVMPEHLVLYSQSIQIQQAIYGLR